MLKRNGPNSDPEVLLKAVQTNYQSLYWLLFLTNGLQDSFLSTLVIY